MNSKIKEVLDAFDADMKAIGGCTNGNCCVRQPVGMHTNGRCRCAEDKYKARRIAHAARKLRGSLLNILEFGDEVAS